MDKLIVIVGPTASGKSDLAVQIAKRFNGEVISADSRQVYRGLNIGSAKVMRDGRIKKYSHKKVIHHLIDVASPKKIFTVAQYQKKTRRIIKELLNKKITPVICGGTGLYIQAVVDGLLFPEVPPNPKLRRKLEKKSVRELFQILRTKDEGRAAAIDRNNPRRLIRAIEIVSALKKVPPLRKDALPCHVLFLGIFPEKRVIENQCRKRVRKWASGVLAKEISALRASGLSFKRIESFGLVYRWGSFLAQKKVLKKHFTNGLEKDLKQYVKRQMTWFKKDKRIVWVKTRKEGVKIAASFLKN